MTSSDDEEGLTTSMFQEPPNYFQPETPAKHTSYTLLSGQTLHLRLVGHNPLWGHYLWNGALILTTYLQTHIPHLIQQKTVLELGAGAGLPSLAAGILGARKVVVTDYPDGELIENLWENIRTCEEVVGKGNGNVVAEGYLWGADPKGLLGHLPEESNGEGSRQGKGFDILLLADLLFNHSCRGQLVDTICNTLKRTGEARALVFFTPYRPWLLERDMAFFDVCRSRGLRVEKVLEERMERVMFEGDRGDEGVRRTVWGFEVRWGDLGEGVVDG